MERKLHDAASKNSIPELLDLLNTDPLALQKSCLQLGDYRDTPLHIAAMLGHLEFAEELLTRLPSLASVVDVQKSTPLHIAAATSHVEMVKLLCKTNSDMCLECDRYGRNPLHVAAIRGQIPVLECLLQERPEAAKRIADDGVSKAGILHLCVKYNQVEALKMLVKEIPDDEFVKRVDSDGNTVLHLAVLDKQSKAVNFLLQSTNIDVNAENAYHQTALDILYMKDVDTVGRALLQAGALTSNLVVVSSSQQNQRQQVAKDVGLGDAEKRFDSIKEAGIVATSLIAAATFQGVVNPPGGVWQDNNGHTAGHSVLADMNKDQYHNFLMQNTLAFLASVTILILLLNDASTKRSSRWRLCLLLALMCLTSYAVTALSYSYAASVSATTAANPVSAKLLEGVRVVNAFWIIIFMWPLVRVLLCWCLGKFFAKI